MLKTKVVGVTLALIALLVLPMTVNAKVFYEQGFHDGVSYQLALTEPAVELVASPGWDAKAKGQDQTIADITYLDINETSALGEMEVSILDQDHIEIACTDCHIDGDEKETDGLAPNAFFNNEVGWQL